LNYSYRRCHLSIRNVSGSLRRGGLVRFQCRPPGQAIWDLWLTKWYWGRFSTSTSVSFTRGWYIEPSSGRRTKWAQSHPPPHERERCSNVLRYHIRASFVCIKYGIICEASGRTKKPSQTSWHNYLICSSFVLMPSLLDQRVVDNMPRRRRA
jgi:hypothetical protein